VRKGEERGGKEGGNEGREGRRWWVFTIERLTCMHVYSLQCTMGLAFGLIHVGPATQCCGGTQCSGVDPL
jgi:hypothetical protein